MWSSLDGLVVGDTLQHIASQALNLGADVDVRHLGLRTLMQQAMPIESHVHNKASVQAALDLQRGDSINLEGLGCAGSFHKG